MHRQQLAIAASGIGYIIASLTGLALAPLPDLGSSPAHDRAYLVTLHTGPFTAGSLLNLLAYLALLVFMVQLARLTSPRPGTTVRVLAAAGPTLAAACVASGMALAGAVALHRASLPPPVAATLLDAASLATWISTLGFALALAAAGLSITGANHALARWTGWTALAIAAAFAVCLPFARTGTGHLPAIAADLWIIATTIAVLRHRAGAAAPTGTEEPAALAIP
jgi:hypothetical protein